MIKLFVADLDGCISFPFQSPDWEAFSKIRELNIQSKKEKGIPHLTICTGRPLPYVEAVAQMLDVGLPFIFESGGGLYDAKTNKLTWADAFNENTRKIIEDLKHWLRKDIITNYEGTIPEFAKQTDVGLINPDPAACKAMYDDIKDYVENRYDFFEIHYTDVSVNVILKDSNKGAGLLKLSELTGFSLDEIAYIGDGTNDIPALKKAHMPFAPLNARDETKNVATVIDDEATRAVLKAYQRIVEHNKSFSRAMKDGEQLD